MPNFIMMRLGNDHTAGTTPGGPTPKASVADNDLAMGRVVEAVSHSAYWDDTAFFILEDDAQNGADHVDAHRSLALVISKYAPRGEGWRRRLWTAGSTTTVSVVRTMETLLGLPPMNNNDALRSMIATLFTGPGDQARVCGGLIEPGERADLYGESEAAAAGAKESAKMDFTPCGPGGPAEAERDSVAGCDGRPPVPALLLEKRARRQKKDDDD